MALVTSHPNRKRLHSLGKNQLFPRLVLSWLGDEGSARFLARLKTAGLSQLSLGLGNLCLWSSVLAQDFCGEASACVVLLYTFGSVMSL